MDIKKIKTILAKQVDSQIQRELASYMEEIEKGWNEPYIHFFISDDLDVYAEQSGSETVADDSPGWYYMGYLKAGDDVDEYNFDDKIDEQIAKLL